MHTEGTLRALCNRRLMTSENFFPLQWSVYFYVSISSSIFISIRFNRVVIVAVVILNLKVSGTLPGVYLGMTNESRNYPFGMKNESRNYPFGMKNESWNYPYGMKNESRSYPFGISSSGYISNYSDTRLKMMIFLYRPCIRGLIHWMASSHPPSDLTWSESTIGS